MTDLIIAEGPWLERILDVTHVLWSEGLGRADYGTWQHAQMATPWGRRSLRRVALVEGSMLLASAKRYDFVAHVDGVRTHVLGIGAVFTPNAERGRGHARALIDAMIAEAEARGCRLALLFSEIGPRYYEGLGFTVIDRDEVAFQMPAGHAGAAAVRPGRAEDLLPMAALNAQLQSTSTFALERTPETMEFGLVRRRQLAALSAPNRLAVEWLVTEEHGELAAYVIATRRPRGLVIEDCGDRDSGGTHVAAMVATILEQPSFHPPLVHAWLPESFRAWTQPALWRAVADEVMMIRPIGGAGLPAFSGPVTYWNLDLF
jgi:GNAT superfamily N-acetyltransferase